MKITRIEATPLAIPLAQEFHWAGGAQHGANLVLFAVHTDEGAVGYGESICEDPRAVTAYGELMARQLIGRSPGEMEAILRSIWSEGRWKMFPQFTQLSFAGIEVACWDALGRALGVPTRTFFGGQVQQEIDYFGFLQGDDPATLAEHARQLSGEGFEVIYLKVGRGIERDDSCVAAVREAIGPEPSAPDRPERGLGPGDGGRPDQVAGAIRPRLGRAADTGRRCERPCARPALGGREDRGRPGRVHDEPAPARAREGGSRRGRTGKPRRGRPAPLPSTGLRLRRLRPPGQPPRVHGERDQLLRQRPGRLDDPESDARKPGHAPAPRRAAHARPPARARRAASTARATLRATASSSTTRLSASPTSAGNGTAPTTRSSRSPWATARGLRRDAVRHRRRRGDHRCRHRVVARSRRSRRAPARGGPLRSRLDGKVGGDRPLPLLEPRGRADGGAFAGSGTGSCRSISNAIRSTRARAGSSSSTRRMPPWPRRTR